MELKYQNFIDEKYRELQEAEQRVFQSSPLLLGGSKKLLQVFVLPPATALAATHLPIAGPVVAGAVGQATHWVHSGIHDTVANHLTNQFAEMSKNIQPGFMHWARQRAFDDWTKVRIPDMLAKTDLWARPLSGTIAPSLIGRSMIDTGKLAISFATKGIPTVVSRPIVHLWRQTSQVIHRTQAWLKQTLSELPQQVQQNVRSAIDNIQRRKPAMADELNQAPTERDIDNRAAYVRLLSEANINDPPLTYERIQENIQDSPDLGANYDKQVTYQALTAGKTLDEATAIISQGPNVAQMSEANLQDVSVYLSETTNSVWNQYNTQNPSPAVNQGQSLEPESPTVADSRPQEQSQPRGIDWARQVAFDTVSRPVNRLTTSFMDTGKQAIGYTTQSAARVATLPLTYMRDMTQKVINRAQAWFEETLNKLPESVQQNVRSVIGNMQGGETVMAEELDQNQQPIQDSVVSEAQTVAESNGVVAEPSVEAGEIQGQSLEPEPETVLSQDDTVVEPTDQLDPEQDQSAQLQDEFEVPQDPLLNEQGTQLEADAVVVDSLAELKMDAQQQYAQLLGEFEKNPDLTWDDIQSRINENPEVVNELDQKVVDQAANNGVELEAVQGLVTTEVNFDAFDQGTAIQTEVSESQGQYTELLSEALEEDLTYGDIQKYISEDPQLQEYYDELVVLQGQENGMTEDEARGIVSKASEPESANPSQAPVAEAAKASQSEDLDPLRMINENIVEKLGRNIEIGNLRVMLNRQEIFRLNGDGMIDHNRSSVNLEQAQMIQDALNNPGDFKGTLTIKVGTRTVLRIQNGIAIPDRYGLAGKDKVADIDAPKENQEQQGEAKGQKAETEAPKPKAKDEQAEIEEPKPDTQNQQVEPESKQQVESKNTQTQAESPKTEDQDELAGFTEEQKGTIKRRQEKGLDASKLIAKIKKNIARPPVEQKEQPKRAPVEQKEQPKREVSMSR